MAYDTQAAPGLIAQRNGANGRAVWVYGSADDLAAVLASGYFSNGEALGMKVGDLVIVIDTTNTKQHLCRVSAVSTSATVKPQDVGDTQELTASGAVTPGVQFIDLNHATVAIAATVADAKAHAGRLFVIRDTSASGTAAHTVTLTAGTFDGSNQVATLNAPGEQLIVLFDENGDGTIVQNTGAVALS